MTPAALHAWLVARWTEHRDEAAMASQGPWNLSWTAVHMDGSGTARLAPVGGRAVIMGHFPNGADPHHIVANDPVHVIAVCDAALRRLARHAPIGDVCGWCTDIADEDPCLWRRCPEVLDDAAPWVGRSDFPRELQR